MKVLLVVSTLLLFSNTSAKFFGETIGLLGHNHVWGSLSESSSSESSEEDLDRLLLTYNPKTDIHVVMNKSTDTVPVLDYTRNISSLYNGKTGSAFVFNFETGISVFIPSGSDKTWYSNKKSFHDYFDNLPSQNDIYQYGITHGITFDPTTMTEEISDEMSAIMSTQSADYSDKCEVLANMLHVSKVSSDYLKTSMTGFNNVMGLTQTSFRGDFKWLVGVYQGMGIFFDQIKGGMGTLAKQKIRLNFGRVLTEKSGIHVLIYLLQELHKHLKIEKELEELNSEEFFFSLIEKLGGQIGYGFDGYIHVLAEIVRFKSDKSSLSNVEMALKGFVNDPRSFTGMNVVQTWIESIKDLQEAIKDLKMTDSLNNLSKLLNDIQENKWQIGKINLSHISKMIAEIKHPVDPEVIQQIIKLIDIQSLFSI